jgi:YrhK-like protein
MRSLRSPRWIGALFAIGSFCFLVGPAPGYIQLVGSGADGVTFFVGSIFFTSASALQLAATPREERADWWACVIQFAGTLLFNISTFDAMNEALDTHAENRLVWTPDVFGSICFLVAGWLAYAVRRHARPSTDWWIAALNLLGSVFFGISAVAAFIVPATGTELDLAAANWTTSLGAACFLAGAVLMRSTEPTPQTAPERAG